MSFCGIALLQVSVVLQTSFLTVFKGRIICASANFWQSSELGKWLREFFHFPVVFLPSSCTILTPNSRTWDSDILFYFPKRSPLSVLYLWLLCLNSFLHPAVYWWILKVISDCLPHTRLFREKLKSCPAGVGRQEMVFRYLMSLCRSAMC